MGHYLFNLIKDGSEPGSILIHPKLVLAGAPEFDYYIFREHLRILLKYLNFDEEDITDFVGVFDRSYCVFYYSEIGQPFPHVLSPCKFESEPFTNYASWLAKLSIVEQFPEYFDHWFHDFVTSK